MKTLLYLFVEITEDHGASWKTSPRDQPCLQLSQMENELIRKQGWSGVSGVSRAERSSDPAQIAAGTQEGDCGGETSLYWSSVSNFTGTQVFNRMWSQALRTGWGCRERRQGCEGSEWRQPGLTPAPGSRSAWLLVSCIAAAVSFSCQQAPGPQLCLKRIVQPWVWIYFFSLESAGIERGAVCFACFQPGLLRPPPSGLNDTTKMSRFLHKVGTG